MLSVILTFPPDKTEIIGLGIGCMWLGKDIYAFATVLKITIRFPFYILTRILHVGKTSSQTKQ